MQLATAKRQTTEPREIALLSQARRALAEARSVDEVKKIRDKAEAIRMYARAQGESLGIQNEACEVKLRAERRAGELLAKFPKNPGGRSTATTLIEVGIDNNQSSRWQRIATLPEETFEEFIFDTKEAGRELTTAAVLSLAKSTGNKTRNDAVVAEAKSEEDIAALVTAGEKFGTIYADPPWRYGNQVTRGSTDNHYPTMTVDEIAALPVGDLAAEQSHLWLWTTNGFLFECPRLFDAWGFEFKSTFVWVKPQMGIGNYLRNSHELLLLAVRGGLVGAARDVKSWGEFDRTAHSAKPQEIRRNVIERVSPGPRLELFGRGLVDGWTVWGNQISRTMFDTEVA
jgi:N6-adenosine-specific RNA methylase IME4